MDDKDFKVASTSNSVFVDGQIENRINEEIEWGISFRKNRNQEKQLVLATTESLEFPSSTSRKPMKKKIKRKKHKRTPASPAISERILFNRNTCTQKQYYDMLSQPRPKFHETEEKPIKSSGKSCSPRFEQLALPLKQRVLNTWQDYEDVLAPENKLWLKSLLTREECLAPKAAEKYFSKLDAKKRKDKKKKLKKQREQHVKKPQKSKIVKEIEGLAKDIVNFFAEKMPVNVKYRHMMITELIKDKLVANNLVKPYKRNKRSVAGQTLFDVLDQLSVWLETNIACLTDEDLEQEAQAGSSVISTTVSSYSSSEADVLLSISDKIETISVITIRSALEVAQETASIITQIHDLTDEKEDVQPETSMLDDNEDEIVKEEKTDEAEGEVVKDEVSDVTPEADQGTEEEKDKEGSEAAEIVDVDATETKDSEAAEIVDLDATETKDPEAAEIVDLYATETKDAEAAEIVEPDATETKDHEADEIVEPDATESKDPEAVETKDLEAAEIVDLEDTKTKDLEGTETVDLEATETKDLEVKKSEKLEPEKDNEAHMIVDSILGDYIDSIDMEKEIIDKEIVPVEMKRHVEEHSADATCCVAMKKWAIWLAEVARNTHSWCQWIQQVIAKIRFFAAILKGDVKTADGKRRILYKEEWNSFKETLANDMTAWIEYNTHVKDLSEKIIASFQNKRVVCCPACLDDKLIVSEETVHEVGDQLAEAIQKTGYWRTWLEQVVLQARKLTSLEIELPTAPENYSVAGSALTSYTSFDLIEIKPAQSPSVESSDTSVYIIEEFQ